MTKKSVKNRIPDFSVKGATMPHWLHRIGAVVCPPPQVKNFVPMMKNIL